MAEPAARAGAVVVTLDALPWLERSLESVRDLPAVVVDVGSTDGTPGFVREQFPRVRVLEVENRGLGAGWNRGIEALDAEHVLLLNADAWLVGDALARLVALLDERPRAALAAPRLLNVDGSLQRSVRGFPTLWRLATEYLFLRKLAPRSRVLNGFYAGGFAHDRAVQADWMMGACLLLRRAALDEVGPFDEDFFLFSEETDWCRRARDAGWEVWFTPDAECVHVGGASHGGRLFRENVRGHLRFLAKHRGARYAERARLLLRLSLRLRGLLFRGERGAQYRAVADWLGSGTVPELLAR